MRPVLQSSILFCLLTFPVLHFCLHFLSRVFTFPRFKGRMEISTRKQGGIYSKNLWRSCERAKNHRIYSNENGHSRFRLTLFIFPPRAAIRTRIPLFVRFHCCNAITALIEHLCIQLFSPFLLSRHGKIDPISRNWWKRVVLIHPVYLGPRSIALHRCG